MARSSAIWKSSGSRSTCTGRATRPAGRGGSRRPPISRSRDRRCSLVGDSAMGSPYFQSISLGFECAMFLAGLLAQRDLTIDEVLDRYEHLAYKQWLRVYMRSKMIKHNKDLLQCVGDTDALLDKLHLY